MLVLVIFQGSRVRKRDSPDAVVLPVNLIFVLVDAGGNEVGRFGFTGTLVRHDPSTASGPASEAGRVAFGEHRRDFMIGASAPRMLLVRTPLADQPCDLRRVTAPHMATR